jgi:hypothetical protein
MDEPQMTLITQIEMAGAGFREFLPSEIWVICGQTIRGIRG